MFGSSLLEELPVSDAKGNKKKKINLLKKKISAGMQIQTLYVADIKDIQSEMQRVNKMKTSFVKSCFYARSSTSARKIESKALESRLSLYLRRDLTSLAP